jgi:site-specific DNA recombinase
MDVCTNKAKELACDIIDTYIDSGISGTIRNRPKLMEALCSISTNKTEFFICYDSSRLARNYVVARATIDEIEKNGTKIVFVRTPYEDTPEGRLQFGIMAQFDEYEKERIALRSALGKAKKAKLGKLTHSPNLYGYDFDKETDELILNVSEAETVRKMYKWIVEDRIGPHSIAQKLNNLGVPSKKDKLWQKTTVKRILSNTAYKGTVFIGRFDTRGEKLNKYCINPSEKVKRFEKDRKEWNPVSIAPIVDEDIWEKAQEVLKNARRLWRDYGKSDYLLSALIRCGECGNTMHGNCVSNKVKKKYRYYVCTRKSPGIVGESKCMQSAVNADELEEILWNRIVTWLKDPEELKNELKSSIPNNIEKKREKLNETIEEVNSILKEKNKVADMYQKSFISEDDFNIRYNEIRNRENLLSELRQMLTSEVNNDIAINESIKYINTVALNFMNLLDNLSFDEKRMIIQLLIKEIRISNGVIIVKAKVPKYINNPNELAITIIK